MPGSPLSFVAPHPAINLSHRRSETVLPISLPKVRVVVCLGKIAWDGYLAHLLHTSTITRRSAYTFTHGAEYILPNGLHLLGSYHPSLRNTNTGRLDRTMFTRIFLRARELAGLDN
jgi:uracil-DNA glycosylase